MKRRFLGIFVAAALTLAAGCASTGQAASADPSSTATGAGPVDTQKAAIGVSSPRHLKVALLTARQMLAGEGTWTAKQVEIVVYGKALRSLQQGSALADDVAKTQQMGAKVVACDIALKGMGIDQSTLLDGVGVVPNGLTELVRLESLGFYAFAF